MAHPHGCRRVDGPLTRSPGGLRAYICGSAAALRAGSGGDRPALAPPFGVVLYELERRRRGRRYSRFFVPGVRLLDCFGKLPRTARPAAEPLLDAERAPGDHRERPGHHEQPDDEEAERVDVQALHPGPERPAEAQLLTEKPR